MLNSNIMNIITTLYFKNKFNNVLKQIKQVEHKYDECHTDPSHYIRIKKKNYDIEYIYDKSGPYHCISRYHDYHLYGTAFETNSTKWFEISGDFVDKPPQCLEWDSSDNLRDYCRYRGDDDDINHLKEMERNVINHFNTLKPVKRIIKIKK